MVVNCPVCGKMFGQQNQITRHMKDGASCRNRLYVLSQESKSDGNHTLNEQDRK